MPNEDAHGLQPTRQLIATVNALYIARQALSPTEITRYTRANRDTTMRHLKFFEERGWIEAEGGRSRAYDDTTRFRFNDPGRAFAKRLLDRI